MSVSGERQIISWSSGLDACPESARRGFDSHRGNNIFLRLPARQLYHKWFKFTRINLILVPDLILLLKQIFSRSIDIHKSRNAVEWFVLMAIGQEKIFKNSINTVPSRKTIMYWFRLWKPPKLFKKKSLCNIEWLKKNFSRVNLDHDWYMLWLYDWYMLWLCND